MKISYITTYDASDIHSWSGSANAIAKMLERQNEEVNYIGNLSCRFNQLFKLKKKIYTFLSGKKFLLSREPFIIKQYARQIKSKLKPDFNIVFSPSSLPIALLEVNKPKIIYTDATFAGMLDFYSNFSNLSSESIKKGNYIEQKALESSQLIIYSSDWAAKTAIENYNVKPEKIKVVPFGANIDCKRNLDDIRNIINNRSSSELNMLFLGVDWIRKGGNTAVKIATGLNKLGLNTKLHIAGIRKLPFNDIPDFIINYGFVDKATEEGRRKIEELFSKCHFLLVPSLAEAFGIVFCEANSFGLPSISTNVGGITTAIKDNINGKTFSLNADISEWCNYIFNVFSDKTRYNDLCMSSFREYETRLNWEVAGRTIMNFIKEI